MENYQSILVKVIALLLGSIPTAYLLTKKTTGLDIREVGTGNIGAANTYDVTQNRTLAFFVFFIDVFKGVLSVLLSYSLFGGSSYLLAQAVIFVVWGHNYSLFLRFKGGRGLATALGATFVLSPLMAILWCFVWIISSKLFKKDVHYANIISSILSPIMLINTPNLLFENSFLIKADNLITIKIMFVIVNILILLKHKDYFKSFMGEFKGSGEEV